MQTVIEKGLDMKGASAVAQCDIRTFYDEVLIVRILRYPIELGYDQSNASAIARLQMCSSVALTSGTISALSIKGLAEA